MRGEAFGAAGDFVTAPEISQIFGELMGLWCVDVWRQLGSPARFSLVELGPGRGSLMKDALRAARLAPEFLAAASIALVKSCGFSLEGYSPRYLKIGGRWRDHERWAIVAA
jgi:NADH dehydrogenase [ubiquinone] 1 alpha subcomplex assembly factor 7